VYQNFLIIRNIQQEDTTNVKHSLFYWTSLKYYFSRLNFEKSTNVPR